MSPSALILEKTMEGLPLPLDVIYAYICCHLRLNDIRRGMLVSKSWFFALITDGAFAHIKHNILSELPRLAVVFERFPWKLERRIHDLQPSQAKKRRTQWIMPKGGTWYTLKHWISPMRHIADLKAVFIRKRNADLHPIIFAELLRCTLQYQALPRNDDLDRLYIRMKYHDGVCDIFYGFFFSIRIKNCDVIAIRRLFTLNPKGPAVSCHEMSNFHIEYRVANINVNVGKRKIKDILDCF